MNNDVSEPAVEVTSDEQAEEAVVRLLDQFLEEQDCQNTEQETTSKVKKCEDYTGGKEIESVPQLKRQNAMTPNFTWKSDELRKLEFESQLESFRDVWLEDIEEQEEQEKETKQVNIKRCENK